MESDSVAPHCGARCIPQKVIAGTVVLPKMGTDWSISPEIVQLQLNKLNKHTQKTKEETQIKWYKNNAEI